jgi:hypothetical protein
VVQPGCHCVGVPVFESVFVVEGGNISGQRRLFGSETQNILFENPRITARIESLACSGKIRKFTMVRFGRRLVQKGNYLKQNLRRKVKQEREQGGT